MYNYYQYISSQTGSTNFPAFCLSAGCSYLTAGMSAFADYFNDAMTVALMASPFIEKGYTQSVPMRSLAVMLPFLSYLDNGLGFGLILDSNIMTEVYRVV